MQIETESGQNEMKMKWGYYKSWSYGSGWIDEDEVKVCVSRLGLRLRSSVDEFGLTIKR